MKSSKRLYHQVYAFSNLLQAAESARRGKRQKPYVARFHFNLEEALLRLESELKNFIYTPGPYKEFYIFEPKLRLISAAPYRDRVVHHALIQVIEPLFERMFIADSYACRVGKGTHRAVDRFTQFCRQNKYVLKCDIHKYFPSIDHDILYGMLCRKIADDVSGDHTPQGASYQVPYFSRGGGYRFPGLSHLSHPPEGTARQCAPIYQEAAAFSGELSAR